MDPSLYARTPTWTDSSSSARKESWTSRYLLPPTSSTAWRSEKIHSFSVTQTRRKTLLCLINAAMCAHVKQHLLSWISSFIYFHPSPPLPPPTLLFHPSPGSSQHGENSSDHPIPASALQPAVQGPDSEWQWWGHYCHHQVSCGTTTSTTGFISGWEPSGCG